MWTDAEPALILALLWLLGLTLAFLLLDQSFVSHGLTRLRHPLLILVLVALLVRLVPALLLPVGAGYDIDSFKLIGNAILNGEDVYTSAANGRHPYFPLQMYIIGATTYFSRVTPLPFVSSIKVPAIVADVCITAVLYKVFQRWGESEPTAVFWALHYALNPISVLVSAYHGQFDSIPVLLLLLSWVAWHFGRHVKGSATLLGFAILDKTWPILFLPVFLVRLPDLRRSLIYTLISIVIPVCFTIAYFFITASNPIPGLLPALTHSGIPGYWGLPALLYVPGSIWFDAEQILKDILPYQRTVLLVVGLFTLYWTRRQSALDAILTYMLSMFVFMFSMGIQWLLWPIAFAIAAREQRWLKWYTIAGTVMIFVHLYGLHLYPWAKQLLEPQTAAAFVRISFLPEWIVVVLWTFNRLRNAKQVI